MARKKAYCPRSWSNPENKALKVSPCYIGMGCEESMRGSVDAARLELGNEGEEELPLEAVAVEVVGGPVRGRHHHRAFGEQQREEPLQLARAHSGRNMLRERGRRASSGFNAAVS